MQVSRIFSALLQLVNNGNVEVIRGEGTFQLRLLQAELPVQDFSEATGPLGNLVSPNHLVLRHAGI